ncbi:hypothetical protein [Chlamydia caviae]|uniref:Lipoprotein n=1 Tax=Chlamydia caviae (strain ATCC VR-813 / DSM 19441 / 03DC25 / GPIC) TaxID=227941 RepID=Q822E5_CHLCV|nr:hypothetical protein [Chlamydia caviae]AAP05479.1 conserved hypothetical protein [Chlamydia caviae GPIC]
MKKMLLVLTYSLSCCFSVAFAESFLASGCTSLVKAVPVSELHFQESTGHVPYSFYYPYEYEYYYPQTYGEYTGASRGNEDCYSRFEDGTFFYHCD